MSDLPHVRDPVTGRCVACEALNNSVAVLDPTFHPDPNVSKAGTGAGLLVQPGGARPVTPVVFDPADPKYIRAIRRGSVTLMKGQGVYHHGKTTRPAFVSGGGAQIVPIDYVGDPTLSYYRGSQPPPRQLTPRSSGGLGTVGLVGGAAGVGALAGGAVRPEPVGYSPRTVVVQQAPPHGANLHGTNFYPGHVTSGSRGGFFSSCCSCCRKRRGGRGAGSGPRRPYWSYEESDAAGRCCKGCLVGFCILLLLLLLLAAILAAIFSVEATNQNTNLFRRFLLVYNDTVCQQQARLNGTTLANCGFTQAAQIVNDATFTNPPITITQAASQVQAAAAIVACAALCAALSAALI